MDYGDESEGLIDMEREMLKSFTAKSFKVIFGFLSVIILARYLGISDLGKYFIVMYLIDVTNQVCSGLGAAVQKKTSEEDSKENEILTISVILYIVYFIFIAVILYLLKDFIFGIISIDSNLFYPFLISVLFTGIFMVMRNYISGIGYPARSDIFLSIRDVLIFGFHIVFYLLGYGVYHFILSTAISSLIISIIMFIDKPITPNFDYNVLLDVLDFSKWSVPNSLLFVLSYRIDVLIVAVFIGSVGVGIYQSAYKLLVPAIALSGSLSRPLNVEVSNIHSKDQKFANKANQIMVYAGILPISIIFGSISLGDNIMTLIYGSDFVGTGLILALISVYVTIGIYRKQIISIIYGINNPFLVSKIQLLYFFINTPLSIYGALEYGIVGVVIMTVLSEVITMSVYIYSQRDILSTKILREMSYQIYSGVIMMIVIITILNIIPNINNIVTICLIIIGAIIYLATLIYMSKDVKDIYRKIKLHISNII
jgi:O-antigen/teichoic acid export membrane protein